MTKVKRFKKSLAVMLATIIVLSMLPGGVLKVSAAGTLSITQTVGTNGYTQDSNGSIVITSDGSYAISGTSTTGGISVQSGVTADIIINSVNLNLSRNQNQCAFSIEPGASVDLILEGSNTLISGKNYAGLFVPSGASVTIMGTNSDSLTVSSDNGDTNQASSDINDGYGAGIGGSQGSEDCGTVIIKGGNITAIGGYGESARSASSYALSVHGAAGIGGADGVKVHGGDGGTVLIEGGTVTAMGGAYAAGIGGGASNSSGGWIGGNGGTVTITGGTVNATCDRHRLIGSGIGGGGGLRGGEGGTVTITGGIVDTDNITGGFGYDPINTWNGENWGGDGGTVTISGGTVTVSRIGGGGSNMYRGKNATVVINGGSVNLNTPCDVTDGHGTSVYKTTLTLPVASVMPVSSLSIAQDSSVSYGFNDMKTDNSGKLYLYLPVSSATTAALTAGGTTYTNYHGAVNAENSGVLKMDQSALTINGISSTYTYKDSISPSAAGGNGTGSVTYTYTGTDDVTGQSYSSTSAPVNCGSYSVTAQKAGDASYYPSISSAVNFVISLKSLSGGTLTLDKNIFIKTGSEIKPGVTVRDSDGNMLDSSSYSVNYTNNTDIASSAAADPPRVTVNGKGNYKDSMSAAFTIEAAPSITVTGNTEDWASSVTVTAMVTVGSSGFGSLVVDDGSGNQTALTGGILTSTSPIYETSTYTYTYSVLKNGSYSFTVTDGAGYTSSQSLTFMKIDGAGPTDMQISLGGYTYDNLLGSITSWQYYNAIQDVTLSATDTESGIDHYEYQIVSLSHETDVQPGTAWTSSSDGRFSISPQFRGVIFARAVDRAGNYSAIVSSTGLVFDQDKPTQPVITATADGKSYNGQWVSGDVTIVASGSSAFSDISCYRYKIGESGTWNTMSGNSLTIQTNMDDNIYIYAVSNSNINSDESVIEVKRDDVIPVIGVSVSGTTGQWTDESVMFTLSNTSDNIAPVNYQVKIGTADWADISGSTFTISEDTDTTCQFRAVTASGKTSAASDVYPVKIDKTAPTITDVTVSTTSWTNGDVTITIHAEDAGSGLYQYSFDGGHSWQDSPSNTYTANTTVAAGTIQVKDIIGNTASYNLDCTIGNIDKDAPTGMTIYFEQSPIKTVAHFLTFGLFFNNTVDVNFSASDNLSGVERYEYQIVAEDGVFDENGAWSAGSLSIPPDFKGAVYARAVDKAGNISGTVTKSLVVDKTTPVITAQLSLNTNDPDASIPVSVKDNGAGVSAVTYQINGGDAKTANLTADTYSDLTKEYSLTISNLPDGIYDVVVNAQDNSGNVASTVTVHVVKNAEQTGFGFTSTELDKTYGDMPFTLAATGGQGYGIVTYTVASGEEILSVDAMSGKVSIQKAGIAVIKATKAAGNGYLQATAELTVYVLKAVPTIKVIPTASDIQVIGKLSSSKLTGGEADVPGTFSWIDPDKIVSSSSTNAVMFTPSDSENYDVVSCNVPVKVSPLLTTSDSNIQLDLSDVTLPSGITAISIESTIHGDGSSSYIIAENLIGQNKNFGNLSGLMLYDIKVLDQNGSPLEKFNGKIKVKLPVPSGMSGDLHVYWYDDATGSVIDMNATQEGGYLVFETNHFSYYAIAVFSKKAPSGSGTISNPDSGSDSFPFVLSAMFSITGCGLVIAAKGRRLRKRD